MKEFLLPHLICPTCLPREERLELRVSSHARGDIAEGDLTCRRCSSRYLIRDGIAHLCPGDPAGSSRQLRYRDREMVNRYLWSHYADLAGDPEADAAGREWRELLSGHDGAVLDAGCAVGRHLFDAVPHNGWGVGCDLSVEFITVARTIAGTGRGTFSLPLEGILRERFDFELPPEFKRDGIEFIVADAQALPFARGTFGAASSLNLIDRVARPLAHLYEMNRVIRPDDASLLLADPFSWTTDAAPEDQWLGGTALGAYPGRGIDNIRSLLLGKDRIISPPWQIKDEGAVTWSLRSHRNHREMIRSEYLLARR